MVGRELSMPDLPGPLRLTSVFPFVGRSAQLDTLRTLIPRAEGEGRRVVLLGGEAGSGKSRLVREFAARAADDGTLVLYGACDSVVRTPYGPFVEALGQLARSMDAEQLRAALGGAGGELTRLLPELPALVGDLPAPLQADPDTERHRLHMAVTDLLTAVGHRRPLLLVIEDGHWADAPTLLLLRHLARAAGTTRMLLLATFRDAEADMPAALTEALADLRRSDDVVRLRLGGLSPDEVSEFVLRAGEARAGGSSESELARTIGDLTRGNAFLVCELWRALVDTHVVRVADGRLELTRPLTELGTPESVREVVSERLSRLEPATSDLLELAATAGAEFELDLLRTGCAGGESAVLGALDEAARNGIVEEQPSRRLAYRFTHELVRRALYDRLGTLRRAELHLRVAEARERSPSRSGRDLADLAFHFAAAAPLADSRRGVEYNLLAARAAAASLAFDEAAAGFRTALELGIEDDPALQAETLLELGTASHRAGKAVDALEAFRAAADIARGLGDAELLARAAIGYEDGCWRPGIVDGGAVELLEEAATALGDGSPELRVRLLSGLARALDFRADHERGAVVRTSAVDLARSAGDRGGLASVLVRSYWSRGTTPIAEIIPLLAEAKELGEELGDTEVRAEAMAWRVPALVALSDLDGARRELVELMQVAEETAQPFMVFVAEGYAAAIANGDGRLEQAEAMVRRSHEWGRTLTGRDASGSYGIQMFTLRREQGRLAELAPVIRILAAEERAGPWRPGLASVLAELGMTADAKRELARVRAEGLDVYRRSLWLAALAYLADACAVVRDEEIAAMVYPELEAISGSSVMIGQLVAWYGAADRYLGMLAATLGEWETAEEHFERALALNRRMGAATWVAHTAFSYGELLLHRGPGERERARRLLGEAASLARRIGMAGLIARIEALGSAVAGDGGGRSAGPGLPDGLSPREAQVLLLVAQGMSNREIGEALVISEHTAANHIRSILQKTGCGNRTEAASYAHRRQLAGP